jgi:hypothetical protein
MVPRAGIGWVLKLLKPTAGGHPKKLDREFNACTESGSVSSAGKISDGTTESQTRQGGSVGSAGSF